MAAALDKLGVDVWTSASATTITQHSPYVSATNNENKVTKLAPPTRNSYNITTALLWNTPITYLHGTESLRSQWSFRSSSNSKLSMDPDHLQPISPPLTQTNYEGLNFNLGNTAVTSDTAHLQSSYFHRPSMYSPKLCRTRSRR